MIFGKSADISKIKRDFVLKGKFPETTYVCTKYIQNFKFLAKF